MAWNWGACLRPAGCFYEACWEIISGRKASGMINRADVFPALQQGSDRQWQRALSPSEPKSGASGWKWIINATKKNQTGGSLVVAQMTVRPEVESKYTKIIYPSQSHTVPKPSHLSFSEIIVNDSEVEAQLFHITLITLEEEKVAIHLWVQRGQVVDVHFCTGSQKFG